MQRPDDKFLASVVDYLNIAGDSNKSIMFVLPNKRSAMFMRTYFKRLQGNRPAMMPTFVTLASFVARMSRLREASRSELLFALYSSYHRVAARHIADENIRSFDEFVFWGDLIINDFSDIDSNAADASALFGNLSRLREIESTYLTPGQADAIEQLWGYRPPSSEDVKHFWTNIIHEARGEEDDKKFPLSASFINLWRILGELYDEFTADLRNAGMAYRGMIVADAAATVRDSGTDDFDFDKYVFAGISFVPENVRRIFSRMRKLGIAEFFWDIPDIFDKAPSDAHCRPDRLLKRNIGALAADFPMPAAYNSPSGPAKPSIDIIGIPSNMMQGQLAAEILRKWGGKGIVSSRFDNTAVIVPDTAVLPSLLTALPKIPGGVNITMGLPARQTPFATLMHTIVSMHLRSRMSKGNILFYREDIIELMANPSIRRIDSPSCDKILDLMDSQSLYTVDIRELQSTAPALAFVFDIPFTGNEPGESKAYLQRLVDGLAKAAGLDLDAEYPDKKSRPKAHEYLVLKAYHDAIDQIFGLASRYNVPLGESTYFRLVERLFSNDTLNVSGAPLRGLQVMGLLESRAIDFDNIIVMSMNERILPRKNPLKTLIPHLLRRAFGLTTIDDIESENAYNFFRLLSRSSNVALLYDSRVSGVAAGEISRYLLQLQLSLPKSILRSSECSLSASISDERTITIDKNTPKVRMLLDLYRAGADTHEYKPRNISASMLKDYLACPLKFYFKQLLKLRDEDENTMFMDAATYGSIIHLVLENLFNPFKGKTVTGDILRNMADSNLSSLVARAIDTLYYKNRYHAHLDRMPGEARVLAEVIVKIVRRTIENDIANAPFTFIAAETGPKNSWEMAPGLNLNFTSKIDRIDLMSDGTLRFIDYKTGSDRNYVESCENLFSPSRDLRNDAMFQLLLYCHAAAEIDGETRPIRPEIFRLRSVYVDNETRVGIGNAYSGLKTPVESYTDSDFASFRQMLSDLITEIFNPEVPFTQTSDNSNCKYCPFLQMCGRIVPEKSF